MVNIISILIHSSWVCVCVCVLQSCDLKFSATKSNIRTLCVHFTLFVHALRLPFFLFLELFFPLCSYPFCCAISREIIVCWYLSSIFVSVCWVPMLSSTLSPSHSSPPIHVRGATKFDCIYHHNHVTRKQQPFLLFSEWWSLPFVILEIHKRWLFVFLVLRFEISGGQPLHSSIDVPSSAFGIDRLHLNCVAQDKSEDFGSLTQKLIMHRFWSCIWNTFHDSILRGRSWISTFTCSHSIEEPLILVELKQKKKSKTK